MSPTLNHVQLDLHIEDLETIDKKCCTTSSTHPACTCPIFLTMCCDMVEYSQGR